MSRTYRRACVPLDCNCGAPVGISWRWAWRYQEPTPEDQAREIKEANRDGIPPQRCCLCYTNRKYDYWTKRNLKRDHKRWGNPPKWFKKMRQRLRRAKVKAAMQKGDYDRIPRFRRENRWLWL